MAITVSVDKAVGMVLSHDITEIVRGVKKGAAFKKGHIVRKEDIEHLKRLGKEHLYVLNLGSDDIHEDEAAVTLASSLAGSGVHFSHSPEEGKIALKASLDGLLRINKEGLRRFNLLGEVMCATLHDNTPVSKGETVAATRLIPLVGNRHLVTEATRLATEAAPVISVFPLRQASVGLVVTGNEVFYGRIEDKFEQVLRDKLTSLGSTMIAVRFAPDDKQRIADEIAACIAQGADLIVTSGGMSVDPDDVTREGILLAGATEVVYGTPVLPGAMFLAAVIGEIPIVGVPACGMFYKITVLDLLLPRILCGERIDRSVVAEMGHGGLCRNCSTCNYPSCHFGK
jgi:Probable molybdopterin binding domain